MGEGGNHTLKRVLGKLHEKKKTVCGDAHPPPLAKTQLVVSKTIWGLVPTSLGSSLVAKATSGQLQLTALNVSEL